MSDPSMEIAAKALYSLSKDQGDKKTGQSSLPTPSPSPRLPTPPMSDDQVYVTTDPSPSQTKKLQCLEPALPPTQCHLPVRLVLDHPSLTSEAQSTNTQLLLSNREENSQPKRPVLHVRGMFSNKKLPPLPDPPRQLSYHADGTWHEGSAALGILLAHLPNLRSYEGEMLEMRDSLGEKMLKLCCIWEHKHGGLPRELVEKRLMYHLESIFKLAGEGDEQERAKMELVLSWLSDLVRHWVLNESTMSSTDAAVQNHRHHQQHQGPN